MAQNYKPAMAQQWNSIVQYTIGSRGTYVAQLSYFGIKGSDLDVLLGPNRSTPGPSTPALELAREPIANAIANIQLDESIGNSIYHSGAAQITRRLTKGFGGSATYTLAKSIDDSSTLGGGVVQIENNVLAERAVTASVPHQTASITFNYQSLQTVQKSDFYWNLVRGWRINGTYQVTTGYTLHCNGCGRSVRYGRHRLHACRRHRIAGGRRQLRYLPILQYRGLHGGARRHLRQRRAQYDPGNCELFAQRERLALIPDR